MSVHSDATAGQYLALVSAVNINAAFTVTGWFKCDDASVQRAICGIFYDGGGNNDRVGIGYSTARHPYAVVNLASTPTRQQSASDTISDNTWYFWALRRTGVTSLELRIGTTSETTITTDVTGRTAANNTSLFDKGGESGSNFAGSMAQVRIWDETLSDGQLATEMNSPTAVINDGHLWAEWRMVNLAGITTDSSSHARTIAASGTFTTGSDDPVQGATSGSLYNSRSTIIRGQQPRRFGVL